MRSVLAAFLILAVAACATAPTPPQDAAAPAALADQIVVMVGIDGLRADAIDRFPEAAPHLRALAARGVRGELVPAMPSVTFVNFYSIATGLYADRTGMVSNAPYSRALGRMMLRSDHGQSEWWGGEPIWATAEKQGVRTATMFWLGSEAEIAGVRPARWQPYDHMRPFGERTDEVLGWLSLPESERPRLVTVYFHAVDSALHAYGIGAPEEGAAIAEVDAEIGRLVAGIDALGLAARTNIIVVADHGMTNVPDGNTVFLDDFISLDDVFVPELEAPDGAGMNALVHVFVEDGADEGEIYRALAAAARSGPFRVFRRAELPSGWRLNHPDRTGDIVVVADEGWLVFARSVTPRYPSAPVGAHGYDRDLPSMRAAFIADGSRFADGVVADHFDNVEIYGLVAEILGLSPAPTDGDLDNVEHILTDR